MKRTSLILVLTTLFILFSASLKVWAESATMTLRSPDGALPVIVVRPTATVSEKFAAEELKGYLEKITGRSFPLVDDQKAPTGKFIAVGKNKLSEAIDISGLNEEQYLIEVKPNCLIILGGRKSPLLGTYVRDRGTLYGVYDVLEQLGVRWYRPEPWGEFVPKIDQITLPVGRRVSRRPDYIMRSTTGGGFTRYREVSPEMRERHRLWCARNRLNWDVGGDPKYGGGTYYRFGHSYSGTVPPEKYYKDHPEYFALIKGKRDPNDLCQGNPELQNVFAENLIVLAKAQPYLSSISVEPNDGCGGLCECPLCRAMGDPKNLGNLSNQVCAFNNIIARKVAAAVPGLNLQWMAYSGHTEPPTVVARLEPNSILSLNSINQWGDYTKNLLDPSSNSNAAFAKLLKGWAKLKPSAIMTYESWGGYGWPGPLPLARVMADRIKNYRPFNVRGLYNEAHPSWGPQGIDFYMCAKLLWNPDLDVTKELNLYYKNFYGPAEKPMKAYHERLMAALASKSYPPVFSGGRGMHLVFTPRLVKELDGYIREAQRLVKGKPLYERRLAGAAAGHKFARRVCELMKLKKRDGVVTPIPGSRGSYLASENATRAYAELKKFLLSFDTGDAVFDIAARPPLPDEKVRDYAASLSYLQDDLLKNGAYFYLSEKDLLSDF